MHNGKTADVVPIESLDEPRQDFGTFKAKDGTTIQVVHVGKKVKYKVTSVVMHGDDQMDVVLYLDFDADTAIDLQVATGLAAIGAKGEGYIDAPGGAR
ncbi:hypothetical protein [Nonomuraea bangladeshensis]|uniref:hypothetical protein n=1 Tax=Nonomuraea bangladeshensis TaxID=404385 RepID=UPI003C3014F9